MRYPLGKLLIVAVVVITLSLVALPTHADDPAVSLSPTSGLRGTVVTLSGSGFTSGTDYAACLTTSPTSFSCLSSVTSFTAASDGSIPSSTTVTVPYGDEPLGTAAGEYYVIVYNAFGSPDVVAYASFTVDASPAPTLTLSPTSGQPGNVTYLSGTNYLPGDQYEACLSTSATDSSDCITTTVGVQATATGDIPVDPTPITIPYGSEPYGTLSGTYYVIIVADGETVVASAPYTVVQLVETVSESPTSGLPGTTITITGSGYIPSEDYLACVSSSSSAFDCLSSGGETFFTTTVSGTIPNDPIDDISVTVPVPYGGAPLGTPGGTYYVVVAAGSDGTELVSEAFTVDPLVPTLTLSPNEALTNGEFTVTGSEYVPDVQYDICLSTSSTSISCLSGMGTATDGVEPSSTGTLPTFPALSFQVPVNTAPGQYFVIAYTDLDNPTVVASQAFTVLPPTLSLSPSSGLPGSSTTLSGSGYDTSPPYAACLSTKEPTIGSTLPDTCVTGSVTADFYVNGAGVIPASETVQIPYGGVPFGTPGGTYYVMVWSTDDSDVASSASFTVVQLVPTLIATPDSGLPGTSTTITGSGYLPLSTDIPYAACLSTAEPSLGSNLPTTCVTGSVTTEFYGSSTGAIPASETVEIPYGGVPFGTPGGTYYLMVWSTDDSDVVSYAPFTVVQLVPTLTDAPASGLPGTSTTITGSGYLPLSTVIPYAACLSTEAPTVGSNLPITCVTGSVTTEFYGSSTGGISETIQIPYGGVPFGTPGGTYYVMVWSTNDFIVVSSTPFTVVQLVPTLIATPDSGPPGTSTTITGSGYLPLSTDTPYAACLSTEDPAVGSDLPTTCVTGSVTTEFYALNSGAIPTSESVDIPSGMTDGTYYLMVWSTDDFVVVSSTPFTVIAPLAVSLTASAGSIVSDGVDSTVLTASPSGGLPPYTSYQWSLPTGLDGSGCTASSSTCTVTSTTPGPYSVSVTVTDSNDDTATSNSVSLTVQQSLTAPTVTASNSVFDEGQQDSFSVSWTGGTGPYTVTLEISAGPFECFNIHESSVYTQSVSGTSANFNGISFFLEDPGTDYYCATVVDSSSPQETAQSSVGTLTINNDPSGLTISASPTTLSQGATSLLSSVGPTGGTAPYTYQWFVQAPGSPYLLDIPGATSPTYSFVTTTSTQPGGYLFALSAFDAKGVEVLTSGLVVNVNKVSTSTSTAVYDTATSAAWSGSEVTGASAYDTATVVGEPTFVPTGTVVYSLYSGASCSGTALSQDAVTLSSESVPSSSATAALAGGSYSFQATYSGDSNYLTSTSSCEAFTVNVAPSSLATTVYDASTNAPWSGTEVAGATAYDTSTVTGVSGFVPTGTVTYSFYSGPSCGGAPVPFWNPEPLTSGVAPSSIPSPTLQAGSYSFNAVYSGDSNYASSTSACEPISVLTATPSISTQVSAGTVTAGNPATDTAAVSGGFGPTGSVTFKVYSNSACTSTVFSSTNGLSGGSATSGAFTPSAPGTYYWSATYSGDSNNNAVSSPCGPSGETLTAIQRTTTTTLVCTPSTVAVDVPATCTATVTDTSPGTVVTPTGGVSFSTNSRGTYPPNPCALIPSATSTAVASCTISYTPSPGSEGTALIGAAYAGDADHTGSSAAAFALTATQRTTGTSATCTGPVPVGVASTCTATVTDTSSGTVVTPTGTVTFSSTGSGTAGTATCSSSGASLVCKATYTPSAVGTQTIKATYAGDTDHSGSSGTASLPVYDFTVTLASSSTTIAQGGDTSVTVSVGLVSGSATSGLPSVALTLAGLPSGITETGFPSSLAIGGTATFTLQTSAYNNYVSCSQVSKNGGQNLQGADLAGCNLAGYNMAGDNLANANLKGADLAGTSFQGSNLAGANLANANTLGAQFQGANLANVDLSGTGALGSFTLTATGTAGGATRSGSLSFTQAGDNLSGDNLQGANTAGADFAGDLAVDATLQGDNLAGDNLQGADFQSANMQGSNLAGANLSYGNFSYITFQGANLSSANMSYSSFNYSNFQGANTKGANITGATFVGATDAP